MKQLEERLFREKAGRKLLKINSGKPESFSQCRMKHEQIIAGETVQDFEFKAECEPIVKNLRVGCAHGQYLNELIESYTFLQSKNISTDFINSRVNSITEIIYQIKDIDQEVRHTYASQRALEQKIDPHTIENNYYAYKYRYLSLVELREKRKEANTKHNEAIAQILKMRDEVTRIICKLLFRH